MKRFGRLLSVTFVFTLISASLFAQEIDKNLISGLKFRNIGPAMVSGRIGDIAVNPENFSEWYVAVSSGHVWKTTNNGHTFTPIFDREGSYSIGCVTIDPSNPHIVWVGSGENNSQRSVNWGDGIYKSTDGGKTWKNMGLEKSEHIGKIIVHPTNSNIVYVAAQGPLWNSGGDRGLYKTVDGGKTWEKVLEISDNTGVTDIVMDSRNPEVVYAASYQRRRHVWTLIDGGPEAAIHKTENGGKEWTKLTTGLPGGELGRIGLAISPVNPDYVFAIIEASEDKGGFFRSTDRGASWEKMNSHVSSSPQYYQELFCDPVDVDKVYSMGTYTNVTLDGGKTFKHLSNNMRHVDDHALWINPNDNKHLIIGGDGGLYDTYDGGNHWRYIENLPVTQFYRIQADNAKPFYNVYGGTQDNNSIGGPSRSINAGGVFTMDWTYVVGGDGYEPQIDPINPNIVYGQWQYGNFVRFDKKSGEITGIQPQAEDGEELRWNWDSPLLISPHNPKRLYAAGNKVYRSDDRGNTWAKISDDLTRQINRNTLEIMGKIQEPEAVAKNQSTSLYGNIISLDESHKQENLLYIGTDDGVIAVTDGNGLWTRTESFPGVPEMTYVSDIYTSRFEAGTVYAAFNNHKKGDFKPYLLKSDDKGKSWTNIVGNLPEDEPIWSIEQDTENPNILFVGTEFGVYVTIDEGTNWIKMTSGIPTAIACRDLDIQEREGDLVVGTFGRGIYILDDYSPIREMAENKEVLNEELHIFNIKDALMYQESSAKARMNEGSTFYMAPNPKFGAVFTYHVKDNFKSKKQVRKAKWADAVKNGTAPQYPTWEDFRQEDLEQNPYIVFTIQNSEGSVVRRLKAPYSKGLHRINWDFRYASDSPLRGKLNNNMGMPVMPGRYYVSASKFESGKFTKLTDEKEFICKQLNNLTLPPSNQMELDQYRKNITKLQGDIEAANKILKQMNDNIELIIKTLISSPYSDDKSIETAYVIKSQLQDYDKRLNGDKSISKRAGNQSPSISDRVGLMVWMSWTTSSAPTTTNQNTYSLANEKMQKLLKEMKSTYENDFKLLNNKLDSYGAPWTPGRFPEIKK